MTPSTCIMFTTHMATFFQDSGRQNLGFNCLPRKRIIIKLRIANCFIINRKEKKSDMQWGLLCSSIGIRCFQWLQVEIWILLQIHLGRYKAILDSYVTHCNLQFWIFFGLDFQTKPTNLAYGFYRQVSASAPRIWPNLLPKSNSSTKSHFILNYNLLPYKYQLHVSTWKEFSGVENKIFLLFILFGWNKGGMKNKKSFPSSQGCHFRVPKGTLPDYKEFRFGTGSSITL